MGVAHGRGHLEPQRQPGLECRLQVTRPLVERHAVHPLHHQERLAEGAQAGVEQARHVGMLESGQRLTLDLEAVAAELGGQAAVHELDGHVLLELLVGAVRQIHRGHAAGAEQAVDGVRAEAHALGHGLHAGRVQQRARAVVRRQQGEHRSGAVVICRVPAHEGLAVGRRDLQRIVEQGIDTCPAIWHD